MCGKSGLSFRQKNQENWEHAPQHGTLTLVTLLPALKEKDVTYTIQTHLDTQADGVSTGDKNTFAGRVCVCVALCLQSKQFGSPTVKMSNLSYNKK